jgi:carbonic anhydrase
MGCGKLMAKETPAPPAAAESPAATSVPPAEPHGANEPAEHASPAAAGRFGLPFAWETSPEEPLAKARSFIAEVLRTNAAFTTNSGKSLVALADGEKPRATVVSCADSRVQADAWDDTPENDDFTVRNIGNQVSSSLGGIEYGVEHLHTPVLLIIGHTGCGAVKAALEKPKDLAAGIVAELAPMKLPAPGPGTKPVVALKEAVIANVHVQVSTAVQHFGRFVHSGELTVIGAVYDLRNDMGGGHGRLHVIDVNTNVEPQRIDAFLRAVQGAPEATAPGGSTTAVAEKRIRAIIERTERSLPPPHRTH